MAVKLELQENLSGDADLASQGFGRTSPTPAPGFDPTSQKDEAIKAVMAELEAKRA